MLIYRSYELLYTPADWKPYTILFNAKMLWNLILLRCLHAVSQTYDPFFNLKKEKKERKILCSLHWCSRKSANEAFDVVVGRENLESSTIWALDVCQSYFICLRVIMPVMLHLPYTVYLRFGLEINTTCIQIWQRENCIHVKPFQDFNHVPSYIE